MKNQGQDTFNFYHCLPLKFVEVSWPCEKQIHLKKILFYLKNFHEIRRRKFSVLPSNHPQKQKKYQQIFFPIPNKPKTLKSCFLRKQIHIKEFPSNNLISQQHIKNDEIPVTDQNKYFSGSRTGGVRGRGCYSNFYHHQFLTNKYFTINFMSHHFQIIAHLTTFSITLIPSNHSRFIWKENVDCHHTWIRLTKSLLSSLKRQNEKRFQVNVIKDFFPLTQLSGRKKKASSAWTL